MPIDKKERTEPGFQTPYGARDLEFENIIGNLMIAEFQVERLRMKLVEKVDGSGKSIAGYYYDTEHKNESISAFSHQGKLYRISVKVDKMAVDK